MGGDLVGRGEDRRVGGAVRKWVRRAEIDAGTRPGMSSEEHAEVKRLKREVAELRRANEILKAAAAFFGAELDRPQPRW